MNDSQENSIDNPIPPQISVLLPVYNGAPYLEEAIQSILDQSYQNFELIIINDGSIDRSAEIIQKFSNYPRIRIYHQSNQGLAATLNRGIKISEGSFIARQDQDDISLPDRFMKQISFLERHPEVGMVGTWAEIWRNNKKTDTSHAHPSEYPVILFDILFDNPFVHSSVMIRREVFDTVGVYTTDPGRQPPEDYELWSRIIRQYKVANIPEILISYRSFDTGMSRVSPYPFRKKMVIITNENLRWITGNQATYEEEIQNISALYHGAIDQISDLSDIEDVQIRYKEIVNQFLENYPEYRVDLQRHANHTFRIIRSYFFRYKYGNYLGIGFSLTCKVFERALFWRHEI